MNLTVIPVMGLTAKRPASPCVSCERGKRCKYGCSENCDLRFNYLVKTGQAELYPDIPLERPPDQVDVDIKEITCLVCGQTVAVRYGNRRLCSPECQKIRHRFQSKMSKRAARKRFLAEGE